MTFNREECDKRLQEQRELGYPNFKDAITHYIMKQYGLTYDDACCLVKNNDHLIMEDITWSQHMGVEYLGDIIIKK